MGFFEKIMVYNYVESVLAYTSLQSYLTYPNHNSLFTLSLSYEIKFSSKEAHMPWKDIAMLAVTVVTVLIEQ